MDNLHSTVFGKTRMVPDRVICEITLIRLAFFLFWGYSFYLIWTLFVLKYYKIILSSDLEFKTINQNKPFCVARLLKSLTSLPYTCDASINDVTALICCRSSMYAVVEQEANDLPLGEQRESFVLKSKGKQGNCHALVVPHLIAKVWWKYKSVKLILSD